jgi:hypothetical protein
MLPNIKEEILIEPFWWSAFTPQIGAGFSKLRAAKIHRAGLVQIKDTRCGDRFITTVEA